MPISPEGEAAIARLAKLTVKRGWDPGKVVYGLVEGYKALIALPLEQRDAVRKVLSEERDAD